MQCHKQVHCMSGCQAYNHEKGGSPNHLVSQAHSSCSMEVVAHNVAVTCIIIFI